MVTIASTTLDSFSKEVTKLQAQAEESLKICQQYTTDFPTNQSTQELQEYVNDCTSLLIENKDTLQRDITNVKNAVVNLSQYEKAMSTEEFRELHREMARLSHTLKSREVIYFAENTCIKLSVTTDKIKEAARIHVSQRNTDDGIKTPRMEIPNFMGKIQHWPTFWNPFKFLVHAKNHITKVEKFTHLVSKLKGDAAFIVQGLEPSAESYDIAIDKLLELYGNESHLYKDLGDSIALLPRAGHTPDSINENLLKLESLLRRLKFEFSESNSTVFISLLSSKFPTEFIKEINRIGHIRSEGKIDLKEWLRNARSALNTLRDEDRATLCSINAAPARTYHTNSTWDPKPNFRRGSSSQTNRQRSQSPYRRQQFNRSRTTSRHSSTESRMDGRSREHSRSHSPHHTRENSQSTSTKRSVFQWKGPCKFCQRDHNLMDCPIEYQSKTNLLKEDKVKCWSCFSTKHYSRECKYGCNKCPGQHHPSVCKPKTTNVNFAESEPRSTGLMVGTVPVDNRDSTITFILDTGSDYSYILRETVKKLDLPIVGNKNLIISTFGGKQSEAKSYDIARLDLVDLRGYAHTVDAFVVNTIADRVGVAQLNDSDKAFIQKHQLRLINGNSSEVRPELLIGVDHFFEMIGEDIKQVRLPSGLHYVPTRHGGLITGSAKKVTQALATFQVRLYLTNAEIQGESQSQEQDFREDACPKIQA